MRTANKDKDNFQLNQYLFKISAYFSTQCSDACLALHCEKNFMHVHSQIQDDASDLLKLPLRGSSGGRFPPELPDRQAAAVCSVAGYATL